MKTYQAQDYFVVNGHTSSDKAGVSTLRRDGYAFFVAVCHKLADFFSSLGLENNAAFAFVFVPVDAASACTQGQHQRA